MNFDELIRGFNSADDSSGGLIRRENINPKYTWNLCDIYASDKLWETDFAEAEKRSGLYKKFEGTLGNSSAELLACLKFEEETGMLLSKLYSYAFMSKDIDLNNVIYQGMYDRVSALYSKISAASSFIRPELVSIPEEKLWKFLDENPGLSIYRHQFEDLIRTKKHTLNKREEELLAMAHQLAEIPYTSFGYFSNADIQFPVVKDENDADMQISHGRYYASLRSPDRNFRERVYRGYYKPFMEHKNMLSSLFNGNVKALMFNARARSYDSTRHASLDANNIPVAVYDNLMKTVNENLSALHRWAGLKKKLLNIDKLRPYDTVAPLFEEVRKKYSYDDAKSIVVNSLQPMGKEYLDTLNHAFQNRWIDVYETKGKRSGAYSSGTVLGVHPYVLLNWNEQLNDVFTLAHEMGHNMHSYYTEKNQPYPYADYSIFLAEVASTTNEALLQDYLIKNARSKNEKLSLLENYLNNITSTFFTQVRYAEFEMMMNEAAENGDPLTPDMLCKNYGDLFQKYWGDSMDVLDEETYAWSRIPHFYYNFYVYQYATGFAASEALACKIVAEGNTAVEKYMGFLKAGSSDYPINVLKSAGVDMSSAGPVLAVINKMEKLLDEMETILEK